MKNNKILPLKILDCPEVDLESHPNMIKLSNNEIIGVLVQNKIYFFNHHKNKTFHFNDYENETDFTAIEFNQYYEDLFAYGDDHGNIGIGST